MRPLRQITFLLEDFALQTPAQQLLDRFLIGYRRDGEFHRPADVRIVAHLAGGTNAELSRRAAEFGLSRAQSVGEALHAADAVIAVPASSAATPAAALVEAMLESAPRGAACFVCGALANDLASAQTRVARAAARELTFTAGTAWPVTWRLPEVDLPADARVDEALIVVQGPTPLAELHALEGLLPVLARRRGGERGVRRVRFVAGGTLWRAGDRGEWSWPLLAAALSRSDSPQGDSLVDGRTQDLVGLGVVPKLARDPRGWLVEHADGVRTTLLVLDGVVADHNFAVRLRGGQTISAQLFRAPVPAEEHFSRLAAVLEDFFRTGKIPWPQSRAVLTAGLLDALRHSSTRTSAWLATPQLLATNLGVGTARPHARELKKLTAGDEPSQPRFSGSAREFARRIFSP